MYARRTSALQFGEPVVVEQQLEEVARPRMAAELRFVNLIGEVPEIRRFVDLDQEVRVSDPAVVKQASLVDDLAASPHLLHGGRVPIAHRAGPRQRHRVTALVA